MVKRSFVEKLYFRGCLLFEFNRGLSYDDSAFLRVIGLLQMRDSAPLFEGPFFTV